nr:immunoglobulin light chain junction region [Macaca mulatta]
DYYCQVWAGSSKYGLF